jgi:hypothetical protein
MRGKMPAVTVLCLFILQLSSPAWSQTTTYIGCLDCVERTMVTIPRDSCSQVGDQQEGWTSCSEETYGLYRFCSLSGSACFNVDAGGGSSGSGGGGDTCVIGPNAGCPAECFSCERDPNRI